ncbi:MAG TPA: alpha/beta hydrolase-fold protein, partial [Deinococcales bacterium]|nr:alpha/beta hydrolase-fold protein [Deinococcales bacterium]
MAPAWRPYPALPDSTVTGDLRQLDGVFSPQLGNTRHLLAWLPPSYEASPERRYPVVYLHDGQNLFDAATSFSGQWRVDGEWRVDESMTRLAAEGLEAIVVGIPNAGDDRPLEYSAHRHSILGGGRAPDYVRFLAETVKPPVDATLRTLPGREDTTVAGSSLGGLVSLRALFDRPDVFSRAGV